MSKNIQICATVTEEINNEILDISSKSNRSFSQTVMILLQQAIKERNRKKKKHPKEHEEIHSENNSTDAR